MIKFFRRIRFKLMEKGRTSRYLKYAISEIILVVIGMIIALLTPLIPKGPTAPYPASKCHE